MAVELYWIADQRVLYFKYIGRVSINEIYEAARLGLDIISQTNSVLVHAVQDTLGVAPIPSEIIADHPAVMPMQELTRMGWMVSINALDETSSFVSKTVAKLMSSRGLNSESFEQALGFLQYFDHTLPDLEDFDSSQLTFIACVDAKRQMA